MRAKRSLFLGLGTNLGDRKDNLVRARRGLERDLGPMVRASRIYETAAWGKIDQSDFLNQVIVLKCSLSPQEILHRALALEIELGRVRKEKWGARSIDIDLLFYDDYCVESENLILPHPFISQRRFILAPLVEIAPEFIHPKMQKSMSELLENCTDQSAVKIVAS